MTSPMQSATNQERDFDIVVLGATGLTGRLVVEQLAERDTLSGSVVTPRRWSIAGRDPARLAKVLESLKLGNVETIDADLDNRETLFRLAMRTSVVLNCAGPYTSQAEGLIEACVQSGTSYVDLSGEIPLLRRVIDRFDELARFAGVQIVQMAGWEAMPADLTTLIACRRASSSEEQNGSLDAGPGAGAPIASVHVAVRFLQVPDGGVPLKQSVSAGTMASIVEILKDPDARLVGRTGGLLPQVTAQGTREQPAGLQLQPLVKGGRVFGPVVPVAFLNPPIVYRTAALLAAERRTPASFAKYREGVDLGPSAGFRGFGRRVAGAFKGLVQTLFVAATRLPLPVRRAMGQLLGKFLPAPGSGPSGRYLTQWKWEIEANAKAINGRTGSSLLSGSGHPGYTATASIIAEVALHIAKRNRTESRSGCLTPALAMIGSGEPQMMMPSLKLR